MCSQAHEPSSASKFDAETLAYLAFIDSLGSEKHESAEIQRLFSTLQRSPMCVGIDELREIVAFCDVRGITSWADTRRDPPVDGAPAAGRIRRPHP
jgi:hypothetical protein